MAFDPFQPSAQRTLAAFLRAAAWRGSGLALLGMAALPGLALYRSEHAEAIVGAGMTDFGLAALVVPMVWAGLALVVAGAGLFAPQPMPPRSWLPQSRKVRP